MADVVATKVRMQARRLDGIVPSRVGVALVLASTMGFFVVWPMLRAHDAIDRAQPDVAAAAGWLSATAAPGVMAAVATPFLVRRAALPVMGTALLVALPLALVVSSGFAEYGPDLFLDSAALGLYSIWVVCGGSGILVVLGCGIAALNGKRAAMPIAWATVLGFLWVWALSALLLLATLQKQADDARSAHAAPGQGMAVLLCLALAAASRSRRD